MSAPEPRTYDLRVEVADTPDADAIVAEFFSAACELAEAHPGIVVRYFQRRRDRYGRPRRRRPSADEVERLAELAHEAQTEHASGSAS